MESTAFARHYFDTRAALLLGASFDSLGTDAKIRRLYSRNFETPALNRVLDSGAKVNVLQQILPSLPAVAAGVQGHIAFCSLNNTAPFPNTPANLVRRSALFPRGRTLSCYIGHGGKACGVLGLDASRRTPAVNAVARESITFRIAGPSLATYFNYPISNSFTLPNPFGPNSAVWQASHISPRYGYNPNPYLYGVLFSPTRSFPAHQNLPNVLLRFGKLTEDII